MKRTISLLLTFVMVIGMFSCISITASAASVSDLKFTLNGDGKSYSASAQNKDMSGSLVIPSTFAGYPVTSISKDGFYSCKNITSVTIPDSVTSIGSGAFCNCKNLSSIIIPNSVTSIGSGAFKHCSGLTSISIPNSITSISNDLFYCCTGLKSIMIPATVTSIGSWAFNACYNLTAITIPDKVTSIGDCAFRDCSGLTSFRMPSGVTVISGSTFSGCAKLVEITNLDNITSIGGYAFNACSSLKSIKLSNDVTNIGESAFQYCSSLSSIIIPEKTTRIYGYTFYGCGSLSYVVLYSSIKNIDKYAFVKCDNIKNTYFTGNEVEWNNIVISGGNDALYNNVVFNYDPLKPFAPKTTTTNEIGGVKVSWNKVDNATKYVVFRRQAGYKTWVNIGTTTGTTLLDKNVKSGVYYCYSVRAYGSTGKYSDFVQANTNTRKYMATPKLTTIYNHQNGLAIKWNAVAGVTKGYRVYRRGAGSTYWTYLGTTKNLYFIDSQVKNKSGEYFRYTVIADGDYHSKFDTTGLYLRRLANPTLTSAVSSKSGITVKWGAVKGTTGYYVYRKTANSTWTRVGTVGGTNNTTFLDKTAKKGTTYIYTVKAVYGATTSAYNTGISCKDKY